MTGAVRRWMSDAGAWSLLDQGAVSAGNFLTAVLLARAVSPANYGIYALVLTTTLFMLFLTGALIVYGLSIHGAAGTDADVRSLAGRSLVLAAGLGTILGAATSSVAIIFHRVSLIPWVTMAVLFLLLQETTRRALMSRLRHREAVWGDALSYLGQAAGIAYLFGAGRLTLVSAFGVMAATSAAGCLVQVGQLKLRTRDFRGALRLLPKLSYTGRWVLLATGAQGLIGQALWWFLALAGTAPVASFQSLLNLLRATNPVMFAVGSVLLPTVANRQRNTSQRPGIVRQYVLWGALVLIPYFAVLLAFPGLALRLLYGASSPYAALTTELRILVLGSVFVYGDHVMGMYFYGLQRGDIAVRCESLAAVVIVVGGIVLVRRAGLLGAAITYDLTFATSSVAFAWFLWHKAPGTVLGRARLGSQQASLEDSSISHSD